MFTCQLPLAQFNMNVAFKIAVLRADNKEVRLKFSRRVRVDCLSERAYGRKGLSECGLATEFVRDRVSGLLELAGLCSPIASKRARTQVQPVRCSGKKT